MGHFHTIIDGHLIDVSSSVRNGNRDTISMVGLAPGPHLLTVAPAWNDHMEATPAAVNVAFTYAGPYLPEPAGYTGTAAASIALTDPTAGSVIHGSSFDLTADIQNFVLCGDCHGKANVAGEGHWHIFLDLPMGAMDPMSMMPHMMTMASDTTQTVSSKMSPPVPTRSRRSSSATTTCRSCQWRWHPSPSTSETATTTDGDLLTESLVHPRVHATQ